MIHEDDYKFIAGLVEKFTGIDLGRDSHYLVEARLATLARELGFISENALLAKVRGEPVQSSLNSELVCAVLDAMTTNESLFFRDEKPFKAMTDHIFPLLAAPQRNSQIRIWSAACSSGQEPYSIAIAVLENAHLLGSKSVEIVATDVCKKVLERAKAGVYTPLEVQRGLPKDLLAKYFSESKHGFQIKDHVRRMVRFQNLNLIEPFGEMGLFDLVFCRNVLIYFKTDTKRKVLEGLADRLKSDGFLVLGGAETTTGITDRYHRMNIGEGVFFQKTALRREVA